MAAGRRSCGRVEITGARVKFKMPGRGTFEALATTDLVLEPGSFTALVGPTGCGKSTLLNLIAGFLRPSEGVARLDDREITGPTPEVGIVFQQYALFPWFSAIGNVEFPLKRLGLSRAERRARATAALAEVGLAGRERQYPAHLSGGMKQRVALARTFVSAPSVLLMDEPFGALDAITRASMHRLLLDVWGRHKATVLFVTHDIDEALLLADRVHVMARNPGRIVETIDVADPRPRDIEIRSPAFVAARARILQLLLSADP
jgi:NitT/TauT family transport system ATP-binding protein